jgi:RNA-directed DNA polymerase
VVQTALKLVLEPIFEADFVPVSYGFRPMRRAHDAIAEIHRFGTLGYRWVLDADIEACLDAWSHYSCRSLWWSEEAVLGLGYVDA